MMKRIWIGALVAALVGCAGTAKQESADTNTVRLTVTEKGFEPPVVTVEAGKPVTLRVTRETDRTCATDLVMASHQIKRPLPLGETVEITFTPEQPGELTYACAMDMFRGKIVVK